MSVTMDGKNTYLLKAACKGVIHIEHRVFLDGNKTVVFR